MVGLMKHLIRHNKNPPIPMMLRRDVVLKNEAHEKGLNIHHTNNEDSYMETIRDIMAGDIMELR